MAVIRISDETKKRILKLQGLYQTKTGERISEGRIVDFLMETVKEDIDLVTGLYQAGVLSKS